jgi:hypothetical protein
MKKILSILLLTSLFFTSCKKDGTTDANAKSNITLHFDNIAGSVDLALNTGSYTNAVGENFTVTAFDYYISNIKLTKIDGTIYVVPQDSSYFLIKESDATTQEVELSNIPVGDYNKVNFTVGIDSTRCTADINKRTGVLDPAAGGLGMYWSWNSGYIFMKLEGTSPASTQTGNKIQYHIGGFGGFTTATINNIKNVSLSFPTVAMVKLAKKPEVHILTDVKKVLSGSTNISIASSPMIMFSAASVNVANNYTSMFTLDHVHND